jgi:hypothetical protein
LNGGTGPESMGGCQCHIVIRTHCPSRLRGKETEFVDA